METKETTGELPAAMRAMDLKTGKSPVLLKNVDLGGGAYNSVSMMPTTLLQRDNNFGKAGKSTKINVNSYLVQNFPDKPVYQYDILIGNGAEKRGLVRAIWASSAVSKVIGPDFIFDGNKIGWSMKKLDRELNISVDLNAERPNPRKKDGEVLEDKHRCLIRAANGGKSINMEVLQAYLHRQTDFSTDVLQCINFLDHLLRETPSKTMINLRRSYFARLTAAQDRFYVGGGVEALKGVYQSLRCAEGGKLVINADVSNSCFWKETTLAQLASDLCGNPGESGLQNLVTTRPGKMEPAMYRTLKRLERNKFYVQHRGRSEKSTVHTIKTVSLKNALTYKFDWTDCETGKTETVSVADFFLKKYNIRLQRPWLPVIGTGKRNEAYPMELCHMDVGQRYPYKLNEDQTSKMIKFAVSLPNVRKQAINAGLQKLQWNDDPCLKNYHLKINANMLETNARILNPPEVQFKTNTARPMYSGRWDLRGKQFASAGPVPLKVWGVCVLMGTEGGRMNGAPSPMQIDNFVKKFVSAYRGHGGVVQNDKPPVVAGIADTAQAIAETFQRAGSPFKQRPQIIMVVLTNRSADVYNRVKRNLDCRWGIVSQCVQASSVIKAADQYISNVLMKFNSKLGGTTCTIKTVKPFFTKPTMIIGADVSHGAPGVQQASLAAMTVSMDRTCSRYSAAVETNGFHLEMITPENMESMFGRLLQQWMESVGGGRLPSHVYYFRDGVSEGQYVPLLRNEIVDLKQIFLTKANGKAELVPKITVVVCEKRHHIRFFPNGGPAADRNQNPVPGTLVDRDVTHPFEQDFYLNSHSAIQGTARPTHYHVLSDEANVPIDEFQRLLYEHCYQFQRATTPVSLFPAVYYAHIASLRAVAHIDQNAHQAWANQRAKEAVTGSRYEASERSTETTPPKLTEMNNTTKIKYAMWYI